VQTWSLLPAGGKTKTKKDEEEEEEKGWVALASSLKIKTTGLKGRQAGDLFFFLGSTTKPRSPQVSGTGKNGSSSSSDPRPPQVTMNPPRTNQHRLLLSSSSLAEQINSRLIDDGNVHW